MMKLTTCKSTFKINFQNPHQFFVAVQAWLESRHRAQIYIFGYFLTFYFIFIDYYVEK